MPLFWVCIHRPNDYDPQVAEDGAMRQAIDDLNAEMVAAGVRVFAGGLHPIRLATHIARAADGQLVQRDGPYLQTSEHVGGFWLLQTDELSNAVEWAKKAAAACRASVEVRQFH